MKQARESEGGASRREVEKTCGRNEAGKVGLPVSCTEVERLRCGAREGVDAVGDVAKREETPAGVVARMRGDREKWRRDFEEERKPERMNPYCNGTGEGRPTGVSEGDGNVARRSATANPMDCGVAGIEGSRRINLTEGRRDT